MVLAGYFFVALAKSVLEPTSMIKYLGFLHDSEQQRYIVPPDKVERFLVLVRGILAARAAPFQTLEKVHGKAVAFSFAVPAAGVFVRSMQHALTAAVRRDARARASNNPIPVPAGGELANDLQAWCALEGDLNGGPWLRPDHWAFRLRMESDASSRRWGGVLFFPPTPGSEAGSGAVFRAAGEFDPAVELPLDINMKEMMAVIKIVLAFVHTHGRTALVGRRLDFGWITKRRWLTSGKGGGRRRRCRAWLRSGTNFRSNMSSSRLFNGGAPKKP